MILFQKLLYSHSHAVPDKHSLFSTLAHHLQFGFELNPEDASELRSPPGSTAHYRFKEVLV